MDFWDLTKLLIRRWYVGLPMLLLSALLTVLTVGRVQPDYIAKAHVQLVAPVETTSKPGEVLLERRNPWLGQGLQTLGNAATVTVLDQAVAKEMKARGLSDSYTVGMEGNSPTISFEAVGRSERQARETAELLVVRFRESVVELQSDYGVTKADSIDTRRLDRGPNVEVSDSKVKRAIVAVAGAGLLLTAAVTIALDAWLRRRSGRRAAASPAIPISPAAGQVERPPAAEARPVEATVRAQPNGDGSAEKDASRIGGGTPSGAADSRATNGGRSSVFVTYQAPGPPLGGEAAEAEHKAAPTPETPEEATIVLPRSLPVKEYSADRSDTTQRIRFRRPPQSSP